MVLAKFELVRVCNPCAVTMHLSADGGSEDQNLSWGSDNDQFFRSSRYKY